MRHDNFSLPVGPVKQKPFTRLSLAGVKQNLTMPNPNLFNKRCNIDGGFTITSAWPLRLHYYCSATPLARTLLASQETAQTHHAALVTLQKQTVKLRESKERAERALQEMRIRHNETEAGAQVGTGGHFSFWYYDKCNCLPIEYFEAT